MIKNNFSWCISRVHLQQKWHKNDNWNKFEEMQTLFKVASVADRKLGFKKEF